MYVTALLKLCRKSVTAVLTLVQQSDSAIQHQVTLAQSSVFRSRFRGSQRHVTLILRILASKRSCFTALLAIIKLLLALLLDMTAAVGRRKLYFI